MSSPHGAGVKAQLRAETDRLAAAEARAAEEAERSTQAISAFSALADRLDALAAERSRPWWRPLAGLPGGVPPCISSNGGWGRAVFGGKHNASHSAVGDYIGAALDHLPPALGSRRSLPRSVPGNGRRAAVIR